MDRFLTFLQTPWVAVVGWGFGVIGWVVGLGAGILQFRSYSEQKKLEKAYEVLLEEAVKHWKARYTDEQVQILRQEEARLRAVIHTDIPREARRTFLEDRLHTLSGDIVRLYESYEEVASEHRDLSGYDGLPAEVRAAIGEAILPEYVAKQRRQRILFRLVAVALICWALQFLREAIPGDVFVTADYEAYSVNWIVNFLADLIGAACVLHCLLGGSIRRPVAGSFAGPSLRGRVVLLASWFVTLTIGGLLLLDPLYQAGQWGWSPSRVPPLPWSAVLAAIVWSWPALSAYYASGNSTLAASRRLRDMWRSPR